MSLDTFMSYKAVRREPPMPSNELVNGRVLPSLSPCTSIAHWLPYYERLPQGAGKKHAHTSRESRPHPREALYPKFSHAELSTRDVPMLCWFFLMVSLSFVEDEVERFVGRFPVQVVPAAERDGNQLPTFEEMVRGGAPPTFEASVGAS
ncbi:hypothetical protein B0J17DRAFT_706142 [Rhizoctonia solani]|nr:hypothetical protein B0J17DRAFT_706142 [Rhizoctonia solani]